MTSTPPAARTRPVTADTIRTAAPDILAFMRLWERDLPGRTVAEFIEEFGTLASVPAGAELLAARFNAPDGGNGQAAAPRW